MEEQGSEKENIHDIILVKRSDEEGIIIAKYGGARHDHISPIRPEILRDEENMELQDRGQLEKDLEGEAEINDAIIESPFASVSGESFNPEAVKTRSTTALQLCKDCGILFREDERDH
ncbi:hypothetical protein PIB30_093840, partial [Stylosanthes scabra]|nr:hypothetical protein [Stylosanthes scabra]